MELLCSMIIKQTDLRGQCQYNSNKLAESIWNKQSLRFELDLSFKFHIYTLTYTVKRNIHTCLT